MTSKPKKFLCNLCGKTDAETEFYPYLTSKCMICKRKVVKEHREIKDKEVRDDKIESIDPDEKIRYLWSEMMKEPFYRNGKKSILDFMEETEQDISDLVINNQNVKSECFKAVNIITDDIRKLTKQINDFDEIINFKISLAVKKMKEEILTELKKDLSN